MIKNWHSPRSTIVLISPVTMACFSSLPLHVVELVDKPEDISATCTCTVRMYVFPRVVQVTIVYYVGHLSISHPVDPYPAGYPTEDLKIINN